MSNITVSTTQNVITVTETGGITVTVPTGQTIDVTVPSSSVNVTNTTDEITIAQIGVTNTDQLIEGTTNLFFTNARARAAISLTTDDSSILSYNSSTGVFTWNTPTTTKIAEGTNLYYTTARANTDFDTRLATKTTTNLAEGTNLYYTTARANTDFDTRLATKTTTNLAEGTNQYFTTARARQSLSAGTGISYDNSTGVITNTSINTDTTYTIDASTATGGANLNLVGSDASTDTVKFASGTNITVSRTDANTITIDGTDLNTTYTISSASTTGGANLTLTGSDASTDSVAYKGAGATTVTSTDANTITITSTDTNTTYTQNASSVTGGANLNLVGSDATTDSVKFAGSGATTITRTDADTITVSSTDTNTTYTQNISSTSGGANLNLVGSDATTDTVKFADGTGVTVAFTDANTATISIGQSVATTANPTFAGITGGAVTVGVDTDQTISTSSGNLILQTAAGVNAGTITLAAGTNGAITFAPNGSGTVVIPTADITTLEVTNIKALDGTAAATIANSTGIITVSTELNVDNLNISGNTVISTDSNGSITLDPNGSGSVALTLANGGNLTNTRNYVLGAIRNATTASNGEVFTLGPAGTGFKGISLDNSADTADGPITIMRSFTGGAVAGAGTRGRLVFERARGTSASPTAIQSGDFIGSVEGTGYTTTGYLADTLAVQPAVFNYTATENWVSNTNLGTQAQLLLAPTATTISTGANLVAVIAANPQTFACRSDAYTWSNGKTGTTQRMALDVSGNLTVSGDLTITGNDIKNSGGSNVISMSTDNSSTIVNTTLLNLTNPTTQTSYNGASNLLINAGNPAAASFNDRISQLRVQTATTSSSEASTITFNTGKYNTGTNVFSATASGDFLGEFFFAGNYGTTSSFTTLGPSVRFRATAAENFTATNSGGAFAINLDKIGGSTPYDAITIDSSAAVIASNALTLTDNSSVNLVGSKITYNRVYGQFEYNTTVTPAAANTAYVFPLGTATTSNIATVGSTSRLIPGAAGAYNFQFSVQVDNADNGADHIAYIWLRKNGADVTGSTGRITVAKSVATIAGWNFVVDSANTTDYFELGYAVSDTNITFPAFAATAFAPSTATLVTTITPVGA